MKKKLLALVFAVTALAQVQAATSELTCKFTNNSVKGNFLIAIDNLEDVQNADMAPIYTDYYGDEAWFSFDGNEDMEGYYYLLLSGDNGYGFDDKGNFVVSLDSDGCDVGILKLYRNNGYRFGYTRVEHRCSGDVPNTYSVIHCQVAKK